MRQAVAFIAVAGFVAITPLSEALARTAARPFCMRGQMSPGFSNCTFDSMAQCRATASGRTGMSCIANPFYKRPSRQG